MNNTETLRKLRSLIAEIEADDQQHWADEPKTLTPQEMIDAIGDIIGDDGCHCDCECENPRRECICEDVEPCLACKICDVIQPQFARVRPSQPAEPAKPPLKVGDRVNVSRKANTTGIIGRSGPGMVTHVDHGGKTVHVLLSDELAPARPYSVSEESGFNIEKIEAEPQLSSCSCMGDVSCPYRRARTVDGGK